MRIVLKVSGESLKGNYNIGSNELSNVFNEIKSIKDNNQLIIVVGGGNFWRGRNDLDIDSSVSDYIGMMGTIMNCLALSSYLNKMGISSSCYSAFEIDGVIKKANINDIENDLLSKVVVLGGGLGVPNFSTDMTTVSKAIEYKADYILMAKNIDGVYNKDPKEEGAYKIDKMTHEELLESSLRQGVSSLMVLDLEAMVELCKHKIPLYIYKAGSGYSIDEIINKDIGTKIIS